MENKSHAVIMGLLIAILVLMVSAVILYDQLRDTKSDYGKLIWCWEEYNAVDRSIEQCIIDKQGTLGECLYEWDHKFKLLTDVGCPYRPIEREELT